MSQKQRGRCNDTQKDNGMHTEELLLPSQSLPRPPGAGRIMSKSAKFLNALNVLYLTGRSTRLVNAKMLLFAER